MAGTFSDKTWSGTPMWQIAEELEEQRKKRDAEERRKASTPVAVLNVRAEGDHHLCELTLLIPSKAALPAESKPDPTNGGFREVKVRGPRRKLRAEAVRDGFLLRTGFHEKGEAEVLRLRRELQTKEWKPGDLPAEDTPIEEKEDQEQRLRLAQRPRGTGWSRQKDAEFFVHTHSTMAYDPKKMQYFTVDAATQRYVPCDSPHDPTDYPISVNAGVALVGRDDADLTSPERPRTLLLKELVLTGRAMKKPLFFLDQPASCIALFEGARGSAAVDYCSRNFHTKLLSKLSSTLQYWSDGMIQGLVKSIFEELDAELLQQSATCYDGVSVGVVILLGDRLTVATLGAVRALLVSPASGARIIGDRHRVTEEGPERQRVDAASGEVVPGDPEGTDKLLVRRPLRPRQTSAAQDQATEIRRVLDCAPDSFAALGFSGGDLVDGKSAKTHYRKLVLKVHPDKAPDELKAQAKEAFAKVEAAVERIEAMCEAGSEATAALHRVLETAGDVSSSVMPRAWAHTLLSVDEDAPLEEAEEKAADLRKTLAKLGQFGDGRMAHPDAARASQILDEALEVLQAPVPTEGAGELEPVRVTRALGLRDLKRPRPIVLTDPHFDVVQLDVVGSHHLALLSSSTAALSDDEITDRIRGFPRQPKAASLVIAQDASVRRARQGAAPSACLASTAVGVFEVKEERAEEPPPAKKAKVDQAGDKVRCLHILIKHKDLKMTKDMESVHRMKGKGPVTRTVAQAERELLEMQRSLLANPNIFHVLARKFSECDTAMQPGQSAGDLGWVTRGTSPNPQFEAAMFALKAYEVSDIISTPRGMHIIQRIA